MKTMSYAFARNLLLALFGLSFSMQVQAGELRCRAGLQPDKEKYTFSSEKQPIDFTTSEMSLVEYGETYSVRKYRVEIENFLVEGILFLNSGHALELSITDRVTGVVAKVSDHGRAILDMSSPKASGFTNISAVCTKQ